MFRLGFNMTNNYSQFGGDGGVIYEININKYPMEYLIVLFGYIAPPIIIFTIIVNIFFVSILVRRDMRTVSNVILSSMAISDIFTGLSYLPIFLYFFTLHNYNQPVSLSWCKAFTNLEFNCPSIFHTASVWLTVTLAVQRYIFVRRKPPMKHWFTMKKTMIIIAIIYFFAILFQLSFFLDSNFIHLERKLTPTSNETIRMCKMEFKRFFMENYKLYINLYYWFRIVFISLVPAIVLIVLNLLLVSTIKSAQSRRRLLLYSKNAHHNGEHETANRRTTLLIVLVVGLFLIAEIPYAVLFIIQSVQFTFEIKLLDYRNFLIASKTVNLFMFMCFPVDFFIYCVMSKKFRDTIRNMFRKRRYCESNNSNTTILLSQSVTVNRNTKAV